MNKQPHHLAETIAEVINLKTLAIYRRTKTYIDEAKRIDQVLAEVGAEILEAISQVPEPDEYEIWLRERKAENKEKCPAPEKNTQEAPIDPGAEPMTQNGRPPIDGGELDNSPVQFKEPNEPPDPDDQPQAETPGGGAVPAAAGSQAGTSKQDTWTLQERVQAWKHDSGLSNEKLGELAKITGVTIGVILRGEKVSDKTVKKVKRAILNWRKKKMVEAGHATETEPKTAPINGSKSPPAVFIRVSLNSWMKRHSFGVKDAARRLSLNECTLRTLKETDELPHPNVLGQLSKHIPAIKREHGRLMKASINRGH